MFVSPVDGLGDDHVALVFNDTTECKQRELDAAVVDRIGPDLARPTDPDAIMAAVGVRLGEDLGASGCGFLDVDETAHGVSVHHAWNAQGVPGLKQTCRLDDYLTDDFVGTSRAGQIFMVSDTASDRRTDAAAFARLKIGAVATVPFFLGGRWTACCTVTSEHPRDWRPHEIALLNEVAERLFARIERARAEAALAASEEQQRLMIELVPALLWQADPVRHEITMNEQWARYTGESVDEIGNYGWLDAIRPDDLPAIRTAFEHAFSTGEPLERQQRIRRAGGGYRWRLVRHVAVGDASGTITRWFGAAIDVHEFREMVERQHVLFAELQHRTRNMMGVVSSTFESMLRASTSLEDFAARYRDRVAALARAQSMLSRLRHDRCVTFDSLIRDEMAAMGASVRVTPRGPTGVALRSSAVQTFSPALHELATNALRPHQQQDPPRS